VTDADKPRVVILGGGVGAMTAAFELSRTGWRDRYESITVYQLGWRLGGKGASGRGEQGRIEEHGLHVWLGFYENAFRMMRECYEELNTSVHKPEDQDWEQLASIDSAFMRANMVVAEERLPGGWVPWLVEFPEDDQQPGTAQSTAELPDAWVYVERAVRLAARFLQSAVRRPQPQNGEESGIRLRGAGAAAGAPFDTGLSLRQVTGPPVGRLWRAATGAFWRVEHDAAALTHVALAGILAMLDDLGSDLERHAAEDHDRLARWLGELARHAQTHVKAEVEASDDARREWYLADILLACARGIIGHGLLHHPDGFAAIDEFDFTDWLVLNGADPESAHCTMVRSTAYDLPFAYSQGDPAKPSLSAGSGLRAMCRAFFTYKGAFAWKMRAGMGDIVFAPLYLVLRERGVDFQFFQRVTSVRVSSDDPHLIEAIELDRQVPETVAAAYRPLVTVKGRPCWPARPDIDIDIDIDIDSLEQSVVDKPAHPWTLGVGPADKVVLGIPIGVVPKICADLISDHPEWKWMVDKVETVATQAFQLWLSESFSALGAVGAPARPDDVAEGLRFLTSAGYVEPFDTWADMSHLIDVEEWPAGQGPRAIAYLCSVLADDDGEDRSQSDWDQVVKRNAEQFLRHHGLHLWPRAFTRYPDEFRWDLLVDPAEGAGRKRFDAQYFRANVDPSERYVLSVPGSGRTRLAPDESGYENLFLAGDWTHCGLDLGCVEAAVMSGMLAAAAVEGDDDLDRIIGATHL